MIEYRKNFFRNNIFKKQILRFLVTFPDYFRDYRTILETFFGNSPERWPKIGVSAWWKCCFWKKIACIRNSVSSLTLTNPKECVESWLRISLDIGTPFPCFHHHLSYMLEKSLPRPERKYLNSFNSTPAVIDYLEERFGIKYWNFI